MRITARLTGLAVALVAIASTAPPSAAQGTAADSAHWRATKLDLDSIARDKTAPAYSKRAQARIRARDSLRTVPPVVPPPVVTPPASTVVRVEIHAQSGDPLPVGATRQLYGDPRDAAGNALTTPVAWSAAPTSVATISGTGLLTAIAAGTVTVTARADAVAASRTFTVTGGTTPPPVVTPPDTQPTQPPVVTPPPGPVVVDTSGGVMPAGATLAELPRVKPVPQYPACQRTTVLTMVSNLQAAFNAATGGDCIMLPAGTTYTGNFTWTYTGAGWVTVMTATTSALPPPGTRMTPSECARLQCAKILSPSYTEAIGTVPGARGLILRGVEISYTPAAVASGSNVLVRLSDPSGANPPRDITIDRSVVRGLPTLDMRRCVLINGRNLIVIDSWLDECHSNNSDSQAVIGYQNSNGILIQNNTLIAGHEIVMFGGSDTQNAAQNPSDVWLVGNHIYHPPSWYKVWQVKNCVETKNVSRYAIIGNVIENCWPDAQAGFAFVLKSENQNGTAPWSTSSDFTIRYNIVIGGGSGFNLSGKGSNPGANITAARFTISDNIVRNQSGPVPWQQLYIGTQLLSQMTDVTMVRNTIANTVGSNTAITMDGGGGAAAIRLVMVGNMMANGAYGIKGPSLGSGTASLNGVAPGYVFTNNVVSGASCASMPATTLCPATFPTASTSTYGADTARVLAATARAVVVNGVYGTPRSVANPRQLKYPPRPSDPRCTDATQWYKVPACLNPVPFNVR